jgi:hypothetical protein
MAGVDLAGSSGGGVPPEPGGAVVGVGTGRLKNDVGGAQEPIGKNWPPDISEGADGRRVGKGLPW